MAAYAGANAFIITSHGKLSFAPFPFLSQGSGPLDFSPPLMPASLRILHLEDDPEDTIILRECLADAGIKGTFVRVETREQFHAKLKFNSHDLVLADVFVPTFNRLQAT